MPVVESGEFQAGELFEGFDVFGRGFFSYFGRKLGRGRSFVPVQCLEIIAHELLVVARGIRAGIPGVGGPEARGIGREAFIDQDQLAIG